MIEHDFDVGFVAELALREKQIQQNFRPIIGVHKWFARRPGTLFRGLLLSEFAPSPLSESYYRSHRLEGLRVADPFMGGGTPLLEANRIGCDTMGLDINPMAWWIVRQELAPLDVTAYLRAAEALRASVAEQLGHLYATRCNCCGRPDASAKYFLWVKAQECTQCGHDIDLFPGNLISEDVRHPLNVFVCQTCGELTETANRQTPGPCGHCGTDLLKGPYAKRGKIQCPHCSTPNSFPQPKAISPRHRLIALEYHCPTCRPSHSGRFFKKPDADDLARAREARERWQGMDAQFVPEDAIPAGDETSRLHRWGYRHYREMFNERQLIGLEASACFIHALPPGHVKEALATNLSDLLRYQNMLCRYDAMALKSLDIFSVHGFPVGLMQCESNLLGLANEDRGTCIGSGGWLNIIEKYRKAKLYCLEPFEIRVSKGKKQKIAMTGEQIGARLDASDPLLPEARLICGDGSQASLLPESLDAVFTDPPYFGNVQYAELMDFCYVWLRRLLGDSHAEFNLPSTRHRDELTVNDSMGRGLKHFTTGLSAVFCRMAASLKPGAPLAFTYHHNELSAYVPLAVAILDAGLACSASLPCPAEMSASIHISGTGSSIVDTVFVCRKHGRFPRRWLADGAAGIANLVRTDLKALEAGGVKPSLGDKRCITHGHLLRLAIWSLHRDWDSSEPLKERLAKVVQALENIGSWETIRAHLESPLEAAKSYPGEITPSLFAEPECSYGTDDDICF